MGPNAGAAAPDPIRPTVGSDAMGNGQAGDLELNAVDGEGGHEVRLVAVCIVQGRGWGVNPTAFAERRRHGPQRTGRTTRWRAPRSRWSVCRRGSRHSCGRPTRSGDHEGGMLERGS